MNLPLIISIVVSVLATGGAAAALYHLGDEQRQNKDHRRHLDVNQLTIGSKISLVGVGLLSLLISTVAFYRIWTEGRLSGLDQLALLLAVLVAVVTLTSAWLVFAISFRDGSPERDDLAYYTRLVQRNIRVKAGYEASINGLEQRIAAIQQRDERPGPENTAGPSDSTANGRAGAADNRTQRDNLASGGAT